MILLLFLLFLPLFAEPDCSQLFRDLETVDYWNKKESDTLPLYYNNVLQVGYWNMPSARMAHEGTFAMGYGRIPPYRNYSLAFQLFPFLELSSSYRIFRGVPDLALSPTGFGDYADKGADIKLSIFLPEEGTSALPGVAIGSVDFMGTRLFSSDYIVLTQALTNYDFEWSLGYGNKRFNGLFGGAAWYPLRYRDNPLALVVEYDAIDYATDPHPDGREVKSKWNYGLKYRFWNYFDFSLSRIRGVDTAFSVTAHCDVGHTEGMLPKYEDALPYRAPLNTEPLGAARTEHLFAQELAYAFQEQGLDILEIRLMTNELRLVIINEKYTREDELRYRLRKLLAGLLPSSIDRVMVVVETQGIPCHEYQFHREHLELYHQRKMSDFEIGVLTPRSEVQPLPAHSMLLYKKQKQPFTLFFTPRTRSLLGSSRGKFKFSVGLNLIAQGYLFDSIYYSIIFGKRLIADVDDSRDTDKLNPSQLINVRSDGVRYEQNTQLMIDAAYLQKNWNLSRGWYTRLAAGHFEQAYGGVASELLYFPAQSSWAVGVEAARLQKRKFSGLGFVKNIRRLVQWDPIYEKFRGYQWYFNVYKDFPEYSMHIHLKAGQFLARDRGIRTEITRYFPSGLRISFWHTLTDAHDIVNRERYHDKGVSFSMPLDIFYSYSSRKTWGHGMSAWLRDVGCVGETGIPIYNSIHSERQ